MNKPFSIQATIFAYATAMLLFAFLCPGEERMSGIIFQLVILWLASEVWNRLFSIPTILFAIIANKKKREDVTKHGKLAKLTSLALLVVPPVIYLVFWKVDGALSGQLCEEFNFNDLVGLFKASYSSVVWLFACRMFSGVVPMSLLKLVDPEYNQGPVEKGMVDTPDPQEFQTQAAARSFHSKQHANNMETMKKMLHDGEEIVFSTAPDAGLLLVKCRASTLISAVMMLIGLAGLVSFFMAQGGMKIFCGAAAVLGLLMAVCMWRALATEKRRCESCDFFLTTERFCRLNTVDKPKFLYWKDKPRHHATFLPNSDVGNVHITPTHGIFAKMLTTILGEPESEKSRTQGELDGMECIHDCAAVYKIVQRLADDQANTSSVQ